MSTSSDYGSEIEWEEEDLAELEATAASQPAASLSRSPAAAALSSKPSSARPPPKYLEIEVVEELPLWRKYRKNKRLSVTDLVSPSWCEVQHSYKLANRSYLPPSQRAPEIITASGTTIKVKSAVTHATEKVLVKGRAVHKELEIQVMGDLPKVEVETRSREDGWGLRILNLLVGLVKLIEDGRTRELPVFGFADEFCTSFVNYLLRSRSIDFPPSPTKRDQRTIDSFFLPKSPKGKEKAVESTWAFVISDTKTRERSDLPPSSQTLPTRIQLMLYHQFLSSLLSSTFSWENFYTSLFLNPDETFSSSFLDSIYPIVLGSSLESTAGTSKSLKELVKVLKSFGEMMGPIDETLEISYRARRKIVKVKKKKETLAAVDEEQQMIDAAIWESLKGAQAAGNELAKTESAMSIITEADEAALNDAIAQSLSTSPSNVNTNLPESQSSQMDVDEPSSLPPLPIPEALLSILESSELPDSLETLPTPFLDLPPSNSQATSTDMEVPTPSVVPRYNLRRRKSSTSSIISLPKPSPTRSSNSSTPSKKRSHPSSPILVPSTPPPSVPPIESTSPSAAAPTLPPSPPDIDDGGLIGNVTFKFDSLVLNEFLAKSVSLWKGEREPQGVTMEDLWKCRRFCEFEDGCEWLEKKGNEATEAYRLSKLKNL